MLMKEEGLRTTENELIHIGKPLDIDEDKFRQQLIALKEACNANSPRIFDLVSEMVPTYRPDKLHVPVA